VCSPSTSEYEIGPYFCEGCQCLMADYQGHALRRALYPSVTEGELEGIAEVVDGLPHVGNAP
jgi:hypothetical protein